MATIINGAPVVEQVYEFGIRDVSSGKEWKYDSYSKAKAIVDEDSSNALELIMRVVYKTEWIDAT